MKTEPRRIRALAFGLLALTTSTLAQTDGTARLETRLLDYNGSGTKHWTVVWITTGTGTFIKTLRKQGPTITSSHWNSHCGQWYSAKASSTAIDGYSSATAQDYAGTNSPVLLSWNCRDASNNLMPDGNYKFWVQDAEDSGQGPYTTTGLLWTKGPAAATNSYPNQSVNFANMKVSWTPATPATIAPTITSAPLPSTAVVGVPYAATCTASGTAPITFTAQNLPPGLAFGAVGAVSGIPTQPGTFNGTITAANGILPNATQSFSIVVSVVPVDIASVQTSGNNLVMTGTGPANGVYCVLASTNMVDWTATATNTIDSTGKFSYTAPVDPARPVNFYRLRVP